MDQSKLQIVATFQADKHGNGTIQISQDDLDKIVLLKGESKLPKPIAD